MKYQRMAALAAIGWMLAFGPHAALAQVSITGDTQYQFLNAAGAFSTGFTPPFPAAGDINGQLNFGGTAAYTAMDDLDSTTAPVNVNNLTFTNTALTTVAPSFASYALTLTTNSLGIGPSIFVGPSNATLTIGLGGTVGFTKNGTGVLTLATTADTFTGNVLINAGTLAANTGQATTATFSIANGAAFSTNNALTATNVITALSGTSTFTATATGGANFSLAGSGNLNASIASNTTVNNNLLANFGGTLTFTNAPSLRIIQSTGGATFVAPFATVDFSTFAVGFNSRNAAQIVLGGLASASTTSAVGNTTNGGAVNVIIGSANGNTTYAGQVQAQTGTTPGATALTKVGTGTLTLTGLSTYAGATNVNGGTLLLNYSVNASNLLAATTGPAFGGGTLSLLGRSTGATTQTLGNVTVNAGGGRVILNANGGTSTALTLGTLTTTASGGALNFNVGAGTSVTTTTPPNAPGIYGGRITYTDATGTNWATSTSTAAPYTLSGYTGYTPLSAAGGTDTNNSSVTDSFVLAASAITNSLRVTNTTAGQTLDLGGTANTLTLTNGGLLFTGANPYTITNGSLASGTSAATPDLIVNQFGTGSLTIGSVIANTGTGATTFTKSGPGTLFLTGANTYTGTTYLNNGITSISSTTGLGAPSATATLNLNSGSLQATGTFTLTGGGIITPYVLLGGGGGTFDVTGTNNLTISSLIGNQIANQFGPLTKTNAGTLTLTSANTYNGATIISGGVLSTPLLAVGGTASGIGQSPATAGALVLNGGTLQYTGAAQSTDRAFTLTQNGGGLDASGSGALTFANTGSVIFTGSGARTLTLTGTGTGTNVLAATIGDGTGGSTSLVKSGASVWQLTNPGNAYTGNTTVQDLGSTLALVAPLSTNPISGSKVVTVGLAAGTTAQLDVTGLSGSTLALAGGQTLAGTGTVTGSAVVSNFTVLSPGSSTTPVATLNISGALTLSGGSTTNFEFNGTTSNDIVRVGGNLTLNATDGVNLYQVGTLNKFTSAGTFTLFNYGTLTGTPSTAFSVLNPATGLSYAFSSVGTQIRLTISGTATVTSTWNVNADGNYGTASNWNNNTVPDGVGTTAIFGTVITAPRTVNIEANRTVGEIDFSNANAYTLAAGGGALTLNNGTSTAIIQDFSGSHTINAPLALAAGLSITTTIATDTLTLGGVISGSGLVTKLGPGALALTGANTYTDGTTITNGTVRINGNSSLGSATATTTLDSSLNPVILETLNSITTVRPFAVNGVNNAIQVDGAANTYEIDGIIANTATGAGTLTKTGLGTLTLGANNTYTGITTISAGALQLGGTGANSAAGSVSGNIVNNGSLVLNRTDDYALGNVISGTGSLTQAGVDNVTLNATNTFTGTTVIQAGSLILGNSLALQGSTLNYNNQGGVLSFGTLTAVTLGNLSGTQNLTLANTAAGVVALTVGNAANSTYSGILSGAGSLVKAGTGTLTLTGNNSYTGTTVVNGGTLELPAGGVINGAALGGGGFLVDGGSLTSTGTTTFAASNTAYTQTSGTANVGTFQSNVNDGTLIRISGGSFTAAAVTLQRTAAFTTLPAAAATGSGFYVTAGTANLGTLTIGTGNSSASARFDGGTTTVTGAVTIGQTGGGRFNLLQVNGGSFTSTDTTGSGIVIGGVNGTNAENAALLLTGGTTSTNVINFGLAGTGGGTETLSINGATAALYVGSGGLVQGGAAGVVTSVINLTSGTIGANADWTSVLPITLNGTTGGMIQTSSATNVPHIITLGGTDPVTNSIAGGITGTGSLTVGGGGNLTIGASSGYTGGTIINAGTVTLSYGNTTAGALPGTVSITINTGGNLALAGLAGVSDRVNNAATVTLNGGRISTNGLSEGAAGTPGLNNLTLNASSVIDLGTGTSTLAFANSNFITNADSTTTMINWVGRLSVFNWSGNATTGSGTDQLYFGIDATGLRPDQLAMIQFYSDNGLTALGMGASILGTGEVLPAVPEPATYVLVLVMIAGAVGWSQRQRIASMAQSLQNRIAA